MKRTKQFLFLPLFFFILLLSGSCEKKDLFEDQPECQGKTVKELNDAIGNIYFDDSRQEFYIFFAEEGTYDSQSVAIPCNLENKFRQEGIKVKVSGEFKPADEIQPSLGGQTFYYLVIRKVSIVES